MKIFLFLGLTVFQHVWNSQVWVTQSRDIAIYFKKFNRAKCTKIRKPSKRKFLELLADYTDEVWWATGQLLCFRLRICPDLPSANPLKKQSNLEIKIFSRSADLTFKFFLLFLR